MFIIYKVHHHLRFGFIPPSAAFQVLEERFEIQVHLFLTPPDRR